MSAWTARARRVAMALAPPAYRVPVEFEVQRRLGKHDPVLTRIDLAQRLPGRAIDVGANTGAYTYAFSRVFEAVEAFEPQPWCAAGLADFARVREGVRVHRLGVSDRAHRTDLYVPVVAGRWRSHLATGLASLTPHPALPSRRVPIDLVPLDAFGFGDVAAIKIDVEGHEREVLEGARETIVRCKPTLVVEIEQRHLAAGVTIDELFATLRSLGYRGWFFRRGVVTPVDEFHVQRDQLAYVNAVALGYAVPEYINNFIFTPSLEPPVTLFTPYPGALVSKVG